MRQLYPRFPPGSSVFLLNVPDVIGHAWLYGWALDAAIREFGYGELSREDPYLAARRRWQAQEAGQLPSPDSFFCYYFRELNLPMIQGLPVDKIYFFEYMPPPQWEGGRIGGAKIFEVGQLRERKDLKAQLLREGVLEG
jgi:hypothetical protein